MDRSAEPVMPLGFLLRLRELYPQFAQQQPPNSGMYMQQDAEECWTQLLQSWREALQVALVLTMPFFLLFITFSNDWL